MDEAQRHRGFVLGVIKNAKINLITEGAGDIFDSGYEVALHDLYQMYICSMT